MRVLTTEYCTLDFDPVRSIVRFTRLPPAYATVDEIHAEAARIREARALLGHGQRVLVDLRAVMPRNDPAFEQAIADVRRAIFAGASRAAILVQTAVGALQTQRHTREDGMGVRVFEDERAAMAHLMGHEGEPDSSSRSHR